MTHSRKLRLRWGYLLLPLCLALALIWSLLMGSGMGLGESIRTLLNPDTMPGPLRVILFEVRLPRLLLALLVGGALSVGGTVMQGVFRNALADPYVLGVASGAGLGAAIAMAMGLQKATLGMGPVMLFAFAGGILSVVLVYAISLRRGRTSTAGLLLSGIAVSAFFSAMTMMVMRLNHDKMDNIIFWSMGSLTSAGWRSLVWALVLCAGGAAVAWLFARDMDLLSQGEESALLMGVNVKRTRMILMALTALITAGAVATTGTIGFIGLMMPHVARMLFGPGHKHLIPLSALVGALFLLIMDTLARTLAAPMELPVGILTALCGGPFFLLILRREGL